MSVCALLLPQTGRDLRGEMEGETKGESASAADFNLTG